MELKSLEKKTKETTEKVKASKTGKFIGEFKAFAVKGNVMDLAIGVIIGTAFSKIVSSVVNDIAMPFIGMFLGVNFSSWVIDLPRFFGQTDPIELKLGSFINTVIEFVILAFVVFLFVRGINKMKKKPAEELKPPVPSKEEQLLAEIRDILRDRKDN